MTLSLACQGFMTFGCYAILKAAAKRRKANFHFEWGVFED
jgi:hypothetical protein